MRSYILGLTIAFAAGQKNEGALEHCEPISIPMCTGIPYNDTVFPNLMGNVNQEQAGQDMSNFVPLIKIKCSEDIHLFLCAMYAPVCTILGHAIPPCRALCQSARRGCEDIMLQFDFPWPKLFECSQFPVGGKPDEICVGDATHTQFSDNELEYFRTSTPRSPPFYGQPRWKAADIEGSVNPRKDSVDFKCPVQLQTPPELEYKLRIGDDQIVDNCGAPCYHNVTYFDKSQIRYAHGWICLWSVVCLCSCLFTLASAAVDLGRFPYPERPIVYIALCYGVVASIFLVGYAHQEDIVCNAAVENRTMNFLAERTIKQGTSLDWQCTLTAMGLYFFLMAGMIWWVVLTLTWFLSAGLKWGQEVIDVKSQIFHTIAWMIPSIFTILMLVLKKVEGDVLSGVCFVGLWDVESLRYFVILPIFASLVVGILFLLFGLMSLIKFRTAMKNEGNKTEKLERLIMRISTFSVLFIIPATALVGIYYYEQANLPKWSQRWQEEICRDPFFRTKWQTPCRYPSSQDIQATTTRPNFNLFLAKYFCILLIGILSGFWVWCSKTVATWNDLCLRLCGQKPSSEAYV